VAATASQFRSQVKGYYWDKFRSDITVNLTMYAANGTEIEDSSEASTYVYHVVMRKLITSYSCANIMVVPTSGMPNVAFELPTTV
jgi:hypothetical protein